MSHRRRLDPQRRSRARAFAKTLAGLALHHHVEPPSSRHRGIINIRFETVRPRVVDRTRNG